MNSHLVALTLAALAVVPAVARQDAVESRRPVPKPAAATQAAAPQFMRLTRDADGAVTRLQTAIARYVPQSGEGELEVDLIGAVHIADRRYYKDLQEQFEEYDALLFELVMPEDALVPDGEPVVAEDPLGMILQMGLDLLELQSQKDHIDYRRPNFVHADLSPEQMAEAMRARGDDVFTLGLSALADTLRQQNLAELHAAETDLPEPPEIDPFALLLDPNAATDLKRYLAEQMFAQEQVGGLGPTLDRLLIDDRNEQCMRVFQRELVNGKKKIGIFYGAMHLADFDRRLREDFGLRQEQVSWLTAWDLR